MSDAPPRLAISSSSPSGLARVRRAAEAVLGRMPAALAADLAALVMLCVLDGREHMAYVQVFVSASEQLGQERERQGRAAGEPFAIVVLRLTATTPLQRILGHELAHVVLGHADDDRTAA